MTRASRIPFRPHPTEDSVSKRRVVVTGLGIVSPVGSDIATAWAAILAGKSGIKPITRIDATPFATRFAGEVRRLRCGAVHLAQGSPAHGSVHALRHGRGHPGGGGLRARLHEGRTATRCGAIMGSGIGGLAGIEDEAITWERTHNPKKTSPFYIPSTIGNMVAGHLSIRFGLRGPNLGVVSACTTSTHAIGFGMRCIQYGDADIIIAGGSEMRHHADGAGGLQPGAGRCPSATTTRRARAVPGTRIAMVSCMGDGGGAMVLEELEHAKARGARIYAEMRGLWHERRRVSHHRAAGRRRRRASRDGQCAARCAR